MLFPLVSPRVRLVSIVVGSAAAAMCAGVVVGSLATRTPVDPCAMPGGIDVASLPDHDRSFALRHALACSDYEHDRITLDAFHAQVTALDRLPVAPAAPVAPTMVWASSVRAMSTQYTATQWSAARALGAPDVYPAGGDNANAWASTEADAAGEFLELGFESTSAHAVDIYETYNPGAVVEVDVITADGKHHPVYQGVAAQAAQPSVKRHIEFQRIDHIVGVRVVLRSELVPGWNEIDAIGLETAL
jgi:hypothetical protein